MKLIEIKPLNIWNGGKYQTASQIGLYNFHGYDFDGTASSVSYKLGFTESSEQADGFASDFFVSINEGSIAIPDSLVQTWGASDEPIIAYTLSELGLQEA